MADHPLVPVEVRALPVPQPRDAGHSPSSALVVVETERGSIYGSLRYARFRRFALEFALDVLNGADEPILATIYAIGLRGGEIPVPPFSIWIEARSEAYVQLRLPALTAMTCRAVVVRLQSTSVHQRLEARMPRPAAALGVLGGLVFAALALWAYSLGVPRVSLDVPSSAAAGATVDAHYATRGNGTRSWELDDASGGARIDGGTLSAKDGTFAVHVPAAAQDRAYVVRVAQKGSFGSAAAASPLLAGAPQTPLARIASLSLDTPVVADGGTVRVRYQTNAPAGRIQAVDAQGTVWATGAVSRAGYTDVQLPRFGRDKELQVHMLVRKGASMASAGVGLSVVLSSPSPSASPSASPGTSAEPSSAPPPVGGRVAALASSSVRAGASVVVTFASHPQHLHVTLFGSQGELFDQRDVPASSQRIALRVPANAHGTMTVVTTYTVGNSEQSEVQRVSVAQ